MPRDFRAGSIAGTAGRCGTPGCHCPRPRLTRKVNSKRGGLGPAALRDDRDASCAMAE